MLKHKASRRYAQAFFDLSRERKCLKQSYHDTQILEKLLDASADLHIFMANPEIPTPKRLAIFDVLFKKHLKSLTFNFLIFLEQKDRLDLTKEICEEFEAFYCAEKGILKAEITTPSDMDKKHILAISKKLQGKLKKEIQTTTISDPSLIAGFKVHIDDLVYDLSISTQLRRFKEELLNI